MCRHFLVLTTLPGCRLITAVSRLNDFAKARKYGDAAELLLVAQQLFKRFDAYQDVSKVRIGCMTCVCTHVRGMLQIAELKTTVNRVIRELRKQVHEEFDPLVEAVLQEADSIDMDNIPPASATGTLKALCALIDALPAEVKKFIINNFCKARMHQYEMQFAVGSEVPCALCIVTMVVDLRMCSSGWLIGERGAPLRLVS